MKVEKDNLILVSSKGYLHAVSSIDGEVLWKKDFTAERFELLEVIHTKNFHLKLTFFNFQVPFYIVFFMFAVLRFSR